MSRDKVDDSTEVTDDGMSMSERERKRRIDALYRWMQACKRRSS